MVWGCSVLSRHNGQWYNFTVKHLEQRIFLDLLPWISVYVMRGVIQRKAINSKLRKFGLWRRLRTGLAKGMDFVVCRVLSGLPNIVLWGSAPRSNPLPFQVPFLAEKVPKAFIYGTCHWKLYPSSSTCESVEFPTLNLLIITEKGTHNCVVVQFYPWFRFYFPLFQM